MSARPWILIVDDHPITRSGLRHCLHEALPAFDVVGVDDADGVDRGLAQQGLPALAVVDYFLGSGTAAPLVAHLRHRAPSLPILIVSGEDSTAMRQEVARLDVAGFVSKTAPPESLLAAVQAVLHGDTAFPRHEASPVSDRMWPVSPAELGLTHQQGRVLEHLLQGSPNKRIASELKVAESTVKEHVAAIFARMGVGSRMEVIAAMQGRRLRMDA